jgi:hypothetical protein
MITDLVRNDLSHTAQRFSSGVTDMWYLLLYAGTSDDFYGYLKTDPNTVLLMP